MWQNITSDVLLRAAVVDKSLTHMVKKYKSFHHNPTVVSMPGFIPKGLQ